VRSDLVAILDEFGGRLFEEMDYIQEGEMPSDLPSSTVISKMFISRIWQYTQRRVLTMEWITGTNLQVEAIRDQGIDALFGEGCPVFPAVAGTWFFHADPHPGNLLATRWQIVSGLWNDEPN